MIRVSNPLRSRWGLLQLALCSLLLAPPAMIILVALTPSEPLFFHLVETVLGRYVGNTLLLMMGTGLIALLFGVSSAWVVSRYRFPGRKVLSWLLVLPAAMPAYLIAYAYTDFLEYAGPIQTAIRSLFRFQSARDYWFFEVRSLPVASVLMAAVLYPYIYIMARTAFHNTSRALFEAAMVSGRHLFWHVGLPLARPAIIAGLSLVLMEVVSDFGTVDYFAIETLTLGIFNVWLGMNNMPAAAQLSLIALLVMMALLAAELFARSRRSFQNIGNTARGVPTLPIRGRHALGAIAVCVLPVMVGFVTPVLILLSYVMAGIGAEARNAFWSLWLNTIEVSVIAVCAIITMAAIIGLITTYKLGKPSRYISLAAACGYAVPGTILAIGVLGFLGLLNKAMLAFGGPLLTGGLFGLIIAYMVRFYAVGFGAVETGIGRIAPQIFEASQTLGKSFSQSLQRIIIPLISSSVGAGALLVFVDIMKELPMTLLLRPFNFETFATFTYQYAKDEMIAEAALPALMIILAGLIPVILLNYSVTRRQN